MNRKNSTSIVCRNVAANLQVKTIFGKIATNVKVCVTCKQIKPVAGFYLESSPKKKNENHVRNQCIECWDVYKGKKSLSSEQTRDLTSFLPGVYINPSVKTRRKRVVDAVKKDLTEFL